MRKALKEADTLLKALDGKRLPSGTDGDYYRTYEELARDIIVRERLLWAIGEKLHLTMEQPFSFSGKALMLTEEDESTFADSIVERYTWEENCTFASLLYQGFKDLGTITQECIYFSALTDDDGNAVDDVDRVLRGMSNEDLAEEILHDRLCGAAIPDFIDMLRETILFDPGREYSDPLAIYLRSERIGHYLEAKGELEEEENVLMEILSSPLVTDYYCYTRVKDGVWYCGTVMASLDEYTNILFDAVNPRFAAACILMEEHIRRLEQGKEVHHAGNPCCRTGKRRKVA